MKSVFCVSVCMGGGEGGGGGGEKGQKRGFLDHTICVRDRLSSPGLKRFTSSY